MAIRYFLMMAVCLSCLGCRAADSSHPKDPTASSAGDPPAVRAQTQATTGSTVLYAYYFHRTFRCYSCLSMEAAADEVLKEHFALQMQNGQVVWMPVNIEDPATEPLRKQLDVQGTGLVLARMENGVYKDPKALDRLWGLTNRPDDFSKCLVDEINKCVSAAQER